MLEIEIRKGDITEMDVDAVVNPANSLLVMGGGVAGAIKRKGGIEIERDAVKYAPVPVGEAILTKGYKLKARYVIHAPTMERPAMRISIDNAIKAILAALELAEREGLKSIAFPGMGTGVGGLSPKEGARAFLVAIESFLKKRGPFRRLKKIILVAFDDDLYEEFLSIYPKIKEVISKYAEQEN